MKPSVYVETTIIGYLAARVSRDLVTASNQQLTQRWWSDHRERFELFVSRFVLDECAAGDDDAAQERLALIQDISVFDVTDDVRSLSKSLMREVPLPGKAQVDSLHISVAAVNGADYLLTWNCKHIANAVLRPRIETVCRRHGFEPPTICTPQELLES
ncbi:MAG: type II toxin-antitoxin system VapC family toxin [Planctomycetes bacterium]|nr:type II toxin-antitoxin system VapC family toxin [Planctomycetota bacterium]